MTGCTDCGWSYMDECEVYEDGTCKRDHDFDDSEPEEKEEIELKPCPFCGGEAYIKAESDSFSTVQYVARCKNCLVEVRIDIDMTKSFKYNRQKVTEAWNHRPSPWHKGTPTENGWYLLECGIGNSENTYYTTDYWSNSVGYWAVNRVIRWQKINEGKEEK